ncbi:hypothetical protein [uncultured Pseudomonas sp.]|uniref:hypothetical protein n=1 Tax=uncultured Pseudomonas sp. TaxID=114707 RepID=UPI0025FED8FA|nr:hypothetical protein [uncultured Pseudomonas sp.]
MTERCRPRADTGVYGITKKNVLTTSTVNVESISETAEKLGFGMGLEVTGRIAEHWDMIGICAYDHIETLDDPPTMAIA